MNRSVDNPKYPPTLDKNGNVDDPKSPLAVNRCNPGSSPTIGKNTEETLGISQKEVMVNSYTKKGGFAMGLKPLRTYITLTGFWYIYFYLCKL
jgi:hypothetical protein